MASGEEVQQVDNSLAGKSIEIVIPEIALTGMAEIVSVADCPPIAEGPGEIVTGTFCTNRAAVLDLQFSGMSEPIGVTSGHPIWSETRLEFVDAGELEVGEEVLALNGKETYLSSITPRAGPETVYNFEVANQHVYYVSQNGLLVHNAGYLLTGAVKQSDNFVATAAKSKYAYTPGAVKSAKRIAPKVPATLKEVGLPARIKAAGGRSLKEEGTFFGWKPRHVTRQASDFTKDELIQRGFTREVLESVAEGYEHIARITPSNPSAAGRAAQLREILETLF